MSVARLGVLFALCGGLACRSSPPAGFDGAAASAFQRETTEQLRGESSPFSVVDAFYVGPGETLRLVRVDRRARAIHEDADDAVELAVGDAFECRKRCGDHLGAIEGPTSIPFGPLRLELAPQPVGDRAGGRVLVHDPEAEAFVAFARACEAGHNGCLNWFPVSEAMIVVAQLGASESTAIDLTTSRGLQKRFAIAGELRFELGGQSHTLTAFRSEGAPASEPMLVPFTDTTNGDSTYPVGRYLQVESDGATAVIDFNRATNPWCAYSPHYNCPVPPASNRLPIAIEAGERSFHP